MVTAHGRRRQPPTGVLVGVTTLLVVLLALLALVGDDARDPTDDPVASPPAPPATSEAATIAPADITTQDLLDRVEPDADGNFDLTITEEELGSAIRNGMAARSTPVDDLRVDVLEGDESGGRVGFDGRLREPDLALSGVISLRVAGGRLEPEIDSVRVGGLPLPGLAEPLLDDLLGEALVLSDELVARGIAIDSLRTSGSALTVTGQASCAPSGCS